jgi:hypothetical protein
VASGPVDRKEVIMNKAIFIGVTFLVVVASSLAAAACEDDDTDGEATPTAAATSETPGSATTVEARLSEYAILPEPATAAAGTVTFNANNIGGTTHELVVIKTDLAPDALPVAADGSVDEGGAGIDVIGEIEEFDAGTTQSAAFDLDAGAYVLICNVVQDDGTSHYAEGMYAAFTVE